MTKLWFGFTHSEWHAIGRFLKDSTMFDDESMLRGQIMEWLVQYMQANRESWSFFEIERNIDFVLGLMKT